MTDAQTPARVDRWRSIFNLVAVSTIDGTGTATFVAASDEGPTPDPDRLARTFEMSATTYEDMGRPTVVTVTVEPGDALNDLAGARDRVERARADVVAQVREARASGQTWDQIGKVFGVTRQAAWEAYAAQVEGGAR